MAVYDFGTLQIQKVIIHEIPRHVAGQVNGIILSEIESPLDQNLQLFFREKVIESVGSTSAYDVIVDATISSPIPNLVFQWLNDPNQDFIAISQSIAKHLFTIQTGVNPGGLLAVISCLVETYPAIAILKLEKEEGVRLEQTQLGGKNTFNLTHIRDLMLTKKTKLFKIGLFLKRGANITDLAGLVCDQQRGYYPTTEVANFFLKGFLGCALAEASDIATKRFYEVSEKFINENITDPATRGNYMTHLFSELNNQRSSISPGQFAETCLKTEHRQQFMNHLEENHVSVGSFDKDINLIKSRITQMQVQFESGIKVLAPNDIYNEMVHLTLMSNGQTRAEIIDDLTSIRGKG